MNWILRSIGWMILLGLSSVAGAQSYNPDTDDRKEIYLDVDVGYNTAYRDKSWVPVEVLVKNEQADLNGILEVRTYDLGGRLQSPIYHLPVNCPQDSSKRFSLMAYLDSTGRLDARLLENGRPAMDTPSYVKIIPVAEEDMMAIVLDDDSLNYSFLNPAVQKINRKIRLHRYALGTKDLALLPNHLEAYEVFDFIVIGSIDHGRVTQRHRELIQQYVESGGTVIVMTGLNGNRFKGSWVEELAGVQFGLSEDINEREAAQRIFPESVGSEEKNEIVLTQLIRPDMSIQVSHADHPLVSKRTLGSGTVYTLAVDAETHAFQRIPLYRSLWSTMMFSHAENRSLNTDFFARSAAQMIPGMSGVNVRSLGFVVLYLLLYVGVGIIGNWLFWNYRKRREMAWVCLVVFSAGFSIYAFVSGTAGWAKVAEKQQIDVVYLKSGAMQSDYYSLMGILTARTRNYSAKQQGTNYLMKDIGTSTNLYNYNQRRRERLPFVFLQGDEPGMERFTVGASELRFVALEGKLEQEGEFEGVLEISTEGIHGVFKNNTQYPIDELALLYEGAIHPVRKKGDEFFIDLSWSAIGNNYNRSLNEQRNNQWLYYNYQGERAAFQTLRKSLFVDERNYLIYKDYPPLLLGWSKTVISDSLVPDREMLNQLQKTLVIAEIPVNDLREDVTSGHVEEELLLRIISQWQGRQRNRQGIWVLTDINSPEAFHEFILSGSNTKIFEIASCELRIAPWMLKDDSSVLELMLYRELSDETKEYRLMLNRGPGTTTDWSDAHHISTEVVELAGRSVQRLTYRINDLRELSRISNQQIITFSILAEAENENASRRQNFGLRYALTAKGIATNTQNNTGEWPQWQ